MNRGWAFIRSDNPDLVEVAGAVGPRSIVIPSSRSSTWIGIIKGLEMVSSVTPCLRAHRGSAVRSQVTLIQWGSAS